MDEVRERNIALVLLLVMIVACCGVCAVSLNLGPKPGTRETEVTVTAGEPATFVFVAGGLGCPGIRILSVEGLPTGCEVDTSMETCHQINLEIITQPSTPPGMYELEVWIAANKHEVTQPISLEILAP